MANIAEKLGLNNEVMELKLGKSFEDNEFSCWSSIRYDFRPASVDTKKMATVDIGEGNQVTVTVPHIDGSGTAQTVFKGSKKPYQKECVLVIDHDTGEVTLEKLSYNIQVKKTRAEGNPRLRSFTPMSYLLSKKSCPTRKKLFKLWSSSNRHFPVQKCSPLPQSPPNCNQQFSPTNHKNRSMPCLVPPTTNSKCSMVTRQEASVNCASVGKNIVEHTRVLSSSESSDSDSQESSDAESEVEVSKKPSWRKVSAANFGSRSSASRQPPSANVLPSMPMSSQLTANFGSRSSASRQPPSANVLPSMPMSSQLSEDLKLSESDSD